MIDSINERLKRIHSLSDDYKRESEKIDQKIIDLERMFIGLQVPFNSTYKINEHDSLVWDKDKKGIYIWRESAKSEYTKLTACPYEIKRKSLDYIAPLLDDIIKRFETELNKGKINEYKTRNIKAEHEDSELIIEPVQKPVRGRPSKTSTSRKIIKSRPKRAEKNPTTDGMRPA